MDQLLYGLVGFSSYSFSKNAKKSGNDTASFFLPEPNHDGWTVIDQVVDGYFDNITNKRGHCA